MKKIPLIVTLIILAVSVSAQQVTRNDARGLAEDIHARLHPTDNFPDQQIFEYTKNGHTLMYEVRMGDKEAVLVSGNYKCKPVLAVIGTTEKSLLCNRDSLPCGLAFMLDLYEEQIERAFGDANSNSTQREWSAQVVPPSRISSVAPLTTSKWKQGAPYNEQIPPPLLGDCEHSLVGCVAVAIGQLMYYYKHPVLMESQSDQFDWCNMEDRIYGDSPDIQKKAVTTLLAECADKVHSIYGCDGTTSLLNWGRDALVNNYKYNHNASFEFQENHSENWWKNEIIGQLDHGYPVPYAGATNMVGSEGHAFICDGYNEFELFHFNWGWGGDYDDVYCELTDIYNDDPDNPYDHWLCAIFYAYPENYLDLCDGTLYLENYYTPFYQVSSNNNYRPYNVVPSTIARLVSSSLTYDSNWRTIPTGATATYQAHKEIVLRDGFTVEEGADFTAQIVPCPNCETRGSDTPVNDEPDRGMAEAGSDGAGEVLDVIATTADGPMDLYPNPTSGEVIVTMEDEVQGIILYNTQGQPVGGWKILSLAGNRATLDVSALSAGPYLVRIATPSGTVTKKLVVQRR